MATYEETVEQVVLLASEVTDVQSYLPESVEQVILLASEVSDLILWSFEEVIKIEQEVSDQIQSMFELDLEDIMVLSDRLSIWVRSPTGTILVGDPAVRDSGS